MRTCEVGLNVNGCEAPYRAEGYSTRSRCYACGQPACKECSRIRVWFGKRRRVCNDCVGEYQQ